MILTLARRVGQNAAYKNEATFAEIGFQGRKKRQCFQRLPKRKGTLEAFAWRKMTYEKRRGAVNRKQGLRISFGIFLQHPVPLTLRGLLPYQ